MLGLFDSGEGGLNTVKYLHKHGINDGLVYLIDRANAPYGIKTEKELVLTVNKNIRHLKSLGATRILIACVTASTVYDLLKEDCKRLAIPIIKPVADAAGKASENKKISVIATNRTVNTHAFKKAITVAEVFELATQELVTMIDSGICDNNADDNVRRKIKHLVSPLFEAEADTLILGCTHFPALKGVIGEIFAPYGVKNIIDTAEIGAKTLINHHG